VGILGGRPRGARWFYGAYADGSKILGLDPHAVQLAPSRQGQGASASCSVELSDDYLTSVHTRYPEVFDLKSMDPSIALGFYCRNKKDFEELEESLKALNQGSSAPELVSFMEKIPKYLSSEAVDDDMIFSELDEEGRADPSDIGEDDEYVLL
jgi:cysteine protease ATG4